MKVDAKICGLSTAETLAATVKARARWVGFVFFPRSPRAVTPEQAASLAGALGPEPETVALLVDPDDELIERVVRAVKPGMLQLHGEESPRRLAQIRERWGIPVMKAIKVARAEDLAPVESYLPVADWLLFDAKAPKSLAGALPGGNALSFDWRLLAGKRWPRPWMLSGGLNETNLKDAVEISGAAAVDVSSGVEDAPGQKSPAKIASFLELCRAL